MEDRERSIKKQGFSARTDLAIETREILSERGLDRSDGVIVTSSEYETLSLTKVVIKNSEGEKLYNKPKGTYITIETDKMKINDVSCHEKVIEVLSGAIKDVISIDSYSPVLIVGLGNWNITPDALGPKTVSKILVTRHIEDTAPEELGSRVRPVSAISPGVMGITGIETYEIVKGITEKIKPSLIIAIDALAARKSSRINSTIQMTDTGVIPGGGVGNSRYGLNYDTLGIPVVAIGVPTVVDAATLVNDTMDRIIGDMSEYAKDNSKEFYSMLKSLEAEEKYTIIKDLLEPYSENMFVTPKEVDAVIERLSGIIANAINIALQENMSIDDINRFRS